MVITNFIIFALFALVPILHCFAFIIGKGNSLKGYLESLEYIDNIKSRGQIKSIEILTVVLFLCIFFYVVVRGNNIFEIVEYFFLSFKFNLTYENLDVGYNILKNYELEINRKMNFIQFAIIASFALFIPTLLTIYSNFKKDVFGLYEKFYLISKEDKYNDVKVEVLEDSKLKALDNKINILNSINGKILKIGRWGVSIYLLSIFLFFVPSNIGITNAISNLKKCDYNDSINKLENQIRTLNKEDSLFKLTNYKLTQDLRKLKNQRSEYKEKLNNLIHKTKASYSSLSLSSTAIQTFIFLGLSLILLCLILFFPFYNNIYVWKNSINETDDTSKSKIKITKKLKREIIFFNWCDPKFKLLLPLVGPISLSLLLYYFLSIVFYLNEDYGDSIFVIICIVFLLMGVLSYFSYIFFRSKFNNIIFLGSFLIFQYVFDNYFIINYEYKYMYLNILLIGIISDIYYLYKSKNFKKIIYRFIIPCNIIFFCLNYDVEGITTYEKILQAIFFIAFFLLGRVFINKFFANAKYFKKFDYLNFNKNHWLKWLKK